MPRTMIVTGGSRGIGAATARLAAARGYAVCVNYLHNAAAAAAVVNAITQAGGQAVAVAADIAIESEVVRLFETCDRELGSLDALVNNAGILETQSRVDTMDAARLQRVFATNVIGSFMCARQAVRRMSTRHGGTGGAIVNLSSGAARLGSPGEYVDYAASKGAIDTFTIGLAQEVAQEGVRVNAVRAGFIYTDIHASGGEPNRVDRVKAFVPMRRGGTAEEVAQAVLWLLSDESSFTTGSFIDVAGGEVTAVISPMRARSPHETHRVSTPLELFFDLVFVVAIAQAAGGLHHAISEGHAAQGIVSYLMVFFAIWWAWMNFTWFASAYDPGDVPYKLAVLAQITGALIVAAGVPAMFEAHAPNGAVVSGYVVMRLAMVAQWLRAAASDPERRTTALRFAGGISVVQAAWVGVLFLPANLILPAFIFFVVAELAVPVWAESAAPTTWHAHHITERYGLFTIIVLGESILAATVAVQAALSSGERLFALVPVIMGGLLTVYSLWWLYFYRPVHVFLADRKLSTAIAWGYGHFLVFAAAAAVGAGIAVSVDQATAHAAISGRAAGAAVALPVAIYVTSLWLLHRRPGSALYNSLVPVSLVLLLLAPLSPQPVLMIGITLSALLAGKLALQPAEAGTPEPGHGS